jgi:hypothetical protein
MTLSVDIGYEYVAWAHYSSNEIKYGIFRFQTQDKPRHCAQFLQSFERFEKLIIEKQVLMNWRCLANQHYLQGAAAALNPSVEIEIQDARAKFKKLGEVCDSKDHAHKRLSVKLAAEWLNSGMVEDVSEMKFDEYVKQDDIADAINMLRPPVQK